MIYKTAIDIARKGNHPEIVELLSKGPIKKKITSDTSTCTLKQENELLHQKNEQLENEVQQMKRYLLAIKEKITTSLYFYELKDYESEGVIGKKATSSVKIVSKTSKEKYAQNS